MRKIKTLKLNYEFKNVFTKGKFCYGNQIIGYILKNKYSYNICNNCSKYFHNWLKGRKDLGVIEVKN